MKPKIAESLSRTGTSFLVPVKNKNMRIKKRFERIKVRLKSVLLETIGQLTNKTENKEKKARAT